MQTLFLSHGSPMLAFQQNPTTEFLRTLSEKLTTPKAIIIISAHWEAEKQSVTGAQNPELIYDFYGFPKELYSLKYPVAGAPSLAKDIKNLLNETGFPTEIDSVRGIDHGVWNPLLLMYPQAQIPVVQVSMQKGQGAEYHYNLGKALGKLSEQNYLIIGSGNLTHNLHEAFRSSYPETPSWVTEFSDWVADKVENDDIESLLNWQSLAPHALKNHPTPDHILPFFVVLGAANANQMQAKRLNSEVEMGVLAMDSYLFST